MPPFAWNDVAKRMRQRRQRNRLSEIAAAGRGHDGARFGSSSLAVGCRVDLPILLRRAGQRLLDARTSGEVLEAMRLGERALHFAKVTDAARETHADCLRIIMRAQMRMAAEIDRGQRTGQVLRPTDTLKRGPVARTSGNGRGIKFGELGITSQRLSEWRKVCVAGVAAVEAAISQAVKNDRIPTRAGVLRYLNGNTGSGHVEWHTPPKIIEAARDVLGRIDLDPASSDKAQATVRAERYFTTQTNGLSQPWSGTIWLNPPYRQPNIRAFVAKLLDELRSGRVSAAIMLTNNSTETDWFQEAASRADAICLVRRRIRFVDGMGQQPRVPVQGQALFYFGPAADRFRTRFGEIGVVMSRFEDTRPSRANRDDVVSLRNSRLACREDRSIQYARP
jgi:phage N-6-adenine-methyltransferase